MSIAETVLKPQVPSGWLDPTKLPSNLMSHYIDPSKMEWAPSKFPGITTKVLYADPESGMSTILFKMEPGAIVPLHEHTAIEQTYMLEGSLVDQEGAALPGITIISVFKRRLRRDCAGLIVCQSFVGNMQIYLTFCPP